MPPVAIRALQPLAWAGMLAALAMLAGPPAHAQPDLAEEAARLTALAEEALAAGDTVAAMKLALAAWPRSADDPRPQLRATLDVLLTAVTPPQPALPAIRHKLGGEAFVGMGPQFGGVAESRDGRRILSWRYEGDFGTTRLWDAATGRSLLAPVGGAVYPFHAAFSPDGTRILILCTDDTVRVLSAADGRDLFKPLSVGPGARADFNGDGTKVLTATNSDQSVAVWDATDGSLLAGPLHHDERLVGAIFNAGETRILSWTFDGSIHLWDVATGRALLPPMGRGGTVRTASFSRDETLIVGASEDGSVTVWDAADGKPRGPGIQFGPYSFAEGATFDGDGRRILSWSQGLDASELRLWDWRSGADLMPPFRSDGNIGGALFSRDETAILTWSESGTVALLDVAEGRPRFELRHGASVLGAAFDASERHVLTWSFDGTARLWNTADGTPAMAPIRPDGLLSGAVFGVDGRSILTWTSDGLIQRWAVEPDRLLPPGAGAAAIAARACDALPDPDLTTLASSHGARIDEPICSGDPPAVDWARLR